MFGANNGIEFIRQALDKARAQIDLILEPGEENEKKYVAANRSFLYQLKPADFDDDTFNDIRQLDKALEELTSVIERQGHHVTPATTVFQFYTRVEFLKKNTHGKKNRGGGIAVAPGAGGGPE